MRHQPFQLPGGVQPVEQEHGDVENHDVGLQDGRGVEQGSAIGHGPHDLAL